MKNKEIKLKCFFISIEKKKTIYRNFENKVKCIIMLFYKVFHSQREDEANSTGIQPPKINR